MRERGYADTRQHACDPSHACHSINNSIIVLDWITFWAEKIKKRERGGGGGGKGAAECDARGETQREAVITRNGPCIYQIISVLYRPIDRGRGEGEEKKFIDDEIPDLHDASVIRSLSSIKAFESFNRKICVALLNVDDPFNMGNEREHFIQL